MPDISLTLAIKEEARRLGFDICRVAPVEEPPHARFFQRWLTLGRTGEMTYLARHVDKRINPALLAEDAPPFRSIIALAVDYHQFDLPDHILGDPSRGIVARYAWGDDYHEIIRPLLHKLDAFIRTRTGRSTLGKGLVDTGPVLERDWAFRAGLGFIGKNCCVIRPGRGSWLFLAVLLTPERLAYDPPPAPLSPVQVTSEEVAQGLPPKAAYGRWALPVEAPEGQAATTVGACGRCTRCLDDCPTDAFVGPFHLDPLACISYWTIESRQAIPRHLRGRFGNRIFGCDICQEVCPWNRNLPRRAPRLPGLRAQQERIAPPLLEGFHPETPYWLQDQAFRERWRRSPLKRAKRAGMLRNVCVALGNWGDMAALPALEQALRDPAPLARGHAAWALGELLRRHQQEQVQALLQARLVGEPDPWVREEIQLALAEGQGNFSAPAT